MSLSRLALASTMVILGACAALACPSDFDEFGNAGVALQPDLSDGRTSDVAVSPDGTIYVASNIGGRPTVLRYSAAGVLDQSYGSAGLAQIEQIGFFENLVVLDDGAVLASGSMNVRVVPEEPLLIVVTILARFDANGVLDTTFGESGVTTTRLERHSWPHDMLVRSDGTIVLVGETFSPPGYAKPFVSSFTSQGQPAGPDGGVRILDELSFARGASAVEVEGRAIVVAGSDLNGDGGRTFLAKVREDGSLDPAFGRNGIRFVRSPRVIEHARKIARDDDGRIYVSSIASFRNFLHPRRTFVRRFLPDGANDPGYGVRGKAEKHALNRVDTPGLAVSGDGKATLAGHDGRVGVLFRFTENGARDRTFGRLGSRLFFYVRLVVVALQDDGRIVVAGDDEYTPLVMRFEGGDWDGAEQCVYGCGNGELASYEECDDGNFVNGDGCSAGCFIE